LLNVILGEIEKLPQVVTRQQVLNWYIDNINYRGGSKNEITTGELIYLIKRSGRQIKGQSRLAIHITLEEERKYAQRINLVDLRQRKVHANVKIPDSEREKVEYMYWKQGLTLKEIADVYRCTATTVSKRMKDWQVQARAAGTNLVSSFKSRGRKLGV
jgi:hypothetical protein